MTGRSQMAADILQSQRRKAGDRGKTTDGDRKIMRTLLACMTGFGLDLIFGDPYWLYHPIRLIGHLISFLEKTAAEVWRENHRKNRLWQGEFCGSW